MNLTDKISNYFTYKEALWLPSWNRAATPEDGYNAEIEANLKELFSTMDKVREFFAKPIIAHVAYRPALYNKAVGGADRSSHIDGDAFDFHVLGMDCDTVRGIIISQGMLETWQMRMEDKPGSSWIHLDKRLPGPAGRFFKP